jgi:hypothetical protein
MLRDESLGRDLLDNTERSFVSNVEFRAWAQCFNQNQFSDVVGGVGSILVVPLLVLLLVFYLVIDDRYCSKRCGCVGSWVNVTSSLCESNGRIGGLPYIISNGIFFVVACIVEL